MIGTRTFRLALAPVVILTTGACFATRNDLRIVHADIQAMRAERTAVIYTTRDLFSDDDPERNFEIGRRVSDSLITLVQGIIARPRFMLAKGGITSSDVATKALSVRRATVRGQIMPGVPVWTLGPESRHPGLCYIVFPGNVGDAMSLAEFAYIILQQ